MKPLGPPSLNIVSWLFDSSVGKKSACNAGDPGSIPGSGRSPGEGIVYPVQYSWASLVAQLVKNPPAMRETWVWSLGWEDPLEKRKATYSSILAWRIPWTLYSMGSQRVGHHWGISSHCASVAPIWRPSQESPKGLLKDIYSSVPSLKIFALCLQRSLGQL